MTLGELTPQEARRAPGGRRLSNPKILARMYISKGTVDYHLNRVFRKHDVRSCAQLDRALAPAAAVGESR
jgi:DNA-binding CsgD family transcriptional regulator